MTTAPPHDLTAALADRYRIERELGRGGMATVYLARDIKHGRLIALKVLHAELAASLGPERFRREVTLAATLQHPHILTLLDSGETPGGQLWFTMPYVEGESLRERLTREHQLRLDDALRIATEVADALDYAHRHGVIHRDIKPENILLTEQHALVADFGIARGLAPGTDSTPRLTETGVALGTPAYMSPEQASADRELDGRSDLYSLACVLYEMLAGEPPFAGPTSQAVLVKRFAGPAPGVRTVRSSVPLAVEDALLRALDPVPASRFATTAQFARALTTAAGSQRSVRPRRMTLTVFAGTAFALVAVLAAAEILSRRDAHRSPSVATAQTASIAVLPFVNVSSDKENEYFSDGMTEELINALSKVEGLHVAARTSAFAFKGKNEDIAEIGRKLRVANLVEGSVRRAGNRLRVTVELVDVTNGYHVWSDRYDRDLKDVFAVQDELARAIVSALRLKLTGASDSLLAHRPTVDLVAYDSYLKGRYAWNQRTPSALHQAADYFEQAVARDQRFAQAYAGLADAYVLMPDYGGAPPTETWPKAKAAAERALALDSTLTEAHASLAYGTWKYGRDWRSAEREFQRAIALNPSYATGRKWYADYLGGRGRLKESLAEMRRAQALDPLSRVISLEVGRCLYFMHQYDDAAVQIEQTIRLDQNFAASHVWLGLVYLQQGRMTEAVPELQRESDLTGRVWLGMAGLAVVRARSGDRRAAAALLAEITERARHDYVPPTAFAFVYTGMGQPTDAFRWLDTAVDTRDGWLTENFFDPLLDPLRTDPRFAVVEQRMGLDSAHPAPAIGQKPSP